MFRQIVKIVSRGVVLKRRLPRDFGSTPLLVSPESSLAYWRFNIGEVDPFLLDVVRELVRPGQTVWDIGANVGLFSFAAASLGARVIAVEPDVWLASLIHRSVLLNGLPVTVLPLAISAEHGIASLTLSEDGRASNSLLDTSDRMQSVATAPLDWLLDFYPAPQVLKIDVEGMEYEVLRGASRVLESRPVIFCEVSREHESVAKLLRAAKYDFVAARQKDRQPLERPSRDTLALPQKG